MFPVILQFDDEMELSNKKYTECLKIDATH